MKQIIAAALFAVAALALVATIAKAAPYGYSDAVLADAPAAYWRLNETSGGTAADTAGTNTGTHFNGVTVGITGALPDEDNKAIQLDGVNDYVRAVDSASLSPTSALSVEMWVSPTAYTGSYPRLLSKPGAYELTMYALAGHEGRLEWKVSLVAGDSILTTVYADRLVLNQWHHVAATYDGATMKVYINGVQKATKVQAGAVKDSVAALTLSHSSWPVAAKLDEVAVYGAALSATQVETHYNAALPGANCLGVPAYPEIRANNTVNNAITPKKPKAEYREWITGIGPYYDQIDGTLCVGGTTEQILETYARKWGIDEIPGAGPDMLKAAAVVESDWHQQVQGDKQACTQEWCFPSPDYWGDTFQSYSILGIKRTSFPDSFPWSHVSTTFAADYYAAMFMARWEGAIPWMSGTEGNLLKTIGGWYCGCDDGGGDAYGNQVLGHLAEKPWLDPEYETVACSTNCTP